MISCKELQGYTSVDFKIERLFRKLDMKVRKKAASGGRRFTVVIYDEFVPTGIFSIAQKAFNHDKLYDDYVMCDPEIFQSNNRSLYLYVVQQKLVHEYGFQSVAWEDFEHKNINNGVRLSFCW